MKIKIVLGFIGAFLVGVIFGAWVCPQRVFLDVSSSDLVCPGGEAPDENGCCTDEVYTNMGAKGFNCCPPGDGDCFPPIK